MDDVDIAELQADEETLTRSMAKCSVRSSGGVMSPLKSRKKYTPRVVIPKSELATSRDNFVGHVGHLSKAKSDELSRAQQQRHAQLRENELRVKIDVQRDRKEMQTKSTKDVYGRYQRHWNVSVTLILFFNVGHIVILAFHSLLCYCEHNLRLDAIVKGTRIVMSNGTDFWCI